jgi:hypothetical protein
MDIDGLNAAYQRFLNNPMKILDGDLFTILIAFTLSSWLARQAGRTEAVCMEDKEVRTELNQENFSFSAT